MGRPRVTLGAATVVASRLRPLCSIHLLVICQVCCGLEISPALSLMMSILANQPVTSQTEKDCLFMPLCALKRFRAWTIVFVGKSLTTATCETTIHNLVLSDLLAGHAVVVVDERCKRRGSARKTESR